MGGVVVGTRLQQLHALKRRVELAIALEARRVALGDRPAHARVTPVTAPANHPPVAPGQGPSPVSPGNLVRVPVHQVRADVLRDWGLSNGYTLDAQRGRIPRHVVDDFTEAHR